ncbi:uncharacterized protein PFL1_01997 [Pseudozyma flocculosa PF-1]|uniref:Uncharacterized protein n=1 Tax=Pseudozyma flocculosa TaxID=84751 RepID=A0A5C3EZ48_9BASI|nr:uncharacterized protein PFL1_01997 [Pseudozyma flocculosa PF-1]EPQ30471.1 hypothetical protein PFL1_01997 [Pseudozyma flocculosa PF-1]SPO37554.1 uncharacterized protein PSFLO_03029 [Pseudozyma flocculosa]
MRFFTATSSLFVSALVVVSAVNGSVLPRETKAPKGDIQVIGKGICQLEKALGVTSTQEFVDTALGGAITDLDKKLGVTAVEDALGLLDCTPEAKPKKSEKGKSDIEIVAKGLCLIQKGLGITDLVELVDESLGGVLSEVEEKLGVTYFEERIGLAGC